MLKSRSYFKKITQTTQQLHHLWQSLRWYDVASIALNRLTSKKHFQLEANIRYAHHARHTLDLYRATQPAAKRRLIVYVHGGAWRHGRKEDYVFLADTLCQAGHDVAIINYRLAPEVIFPDYIDDLDLALHFLQHAQHTLNLPDTWVLMGHSAGAFNVMSWLYHPHPYPVNDFPQIVGMMGLAGPYHFNYLGDALAEPAFDQQVPYTAVMPKYFVRPHQIQHLLLIAAQDQVVGDFNAHDMAAALKQQHNPVEVAIVPQVSHLMIVASLSAFVKKRYRTAQMILDFIARLPDAKT